MGSLVNSTKQGRNYTNSLKSLPEDRSRGMLPNLSYEHSITLVTKPDRHHKKTTDKYHSWT